MARLVPFAVSSTFVHDKDVSNQENALTNITGHKDASFQSMRSRN